ncbi:MAG: class I SAM-dependent methyltransferase [Candidatus Omnitrophica bacterium]|nr:class I SAM-dependent methyltransferase [Candidatus Omnitrophota bacterium]
MEIKNKTLCCRFCGSGLSHIFISLGLSPLSNAYLSQEQLGKDEPMFPLDVYVCEKCFLVQLPEFESPENIFNDYAYFSSYSDTWVKHTAEYSRKMKVALGLGQDSLVIELASNDGCLLKNFVKMGIPALGVEPARNVARVAIKNGVDTRIAFFGPAAAKQLAAQGKLADLLIGNNVLAHVPDLNDFVSAMKLILKPKGVITMEFPHLAKLIEGNQFDTIYHEHFSYFSFIVADKVFARQGLTIFDVEELPTHGGSLRIFAKHKEDSSRGISPGVKGMLAWELKEGFGDISYYTRVSKQVVILKNQIKRFLEEVNYQDKVIVGYGAPAKGNTFLNYCGISPAMIPFTVDKNPHKQGKYLPGSRIPIESPEKIRDVKPDYVLILPWNLKDEITQQLSFIRDFNGKFVTFIPRLEIF